MHCILDSLFFSAGLQLAIQCFALLQALSTKFAPRQNVSTQRFYINSVKGRVGVMVRSTDGYQMHLRSGVV